MSAFTFSAPIVSEEDEKAEREALTEEERQQLYDELFGTEKEIPETDEMRATGTSLMRDAIESMPLEEKSAYMTACERVPELVQSESPCIRFLRATKWNAWSAAKRLADYWKVRVKIFGEKAFMSMTLDGAMEDEVEYLEKAICMSLPPDAHGRPVVLVDRVRCIKEIAPREHAARCIWYIIQTISEVEKAQKLGYVILANYRGYDIYKHYDRILTKLTVLGMQSIPAITKSTHLCAGSGTSVVSSLTVPVYKHMLGKKLRLGTLLHSGSTSEISAEFKNYGLGDDHVNAVFGGAAKNGRYMQQWIKNRRDIERKRQLHGTEPVDRLRSYKVDADRTLER